MEALLRALNVAREVGGYEEVVVLDDQGNAYELEAEMPGNHRPLVLRIRHAENVNSN